MAIGGAFLGGGAEIVPAGFCKLELEILTEDRNNLSATFSIKGTSTYTVTAGADGRAVYTVPSGQTYTVSVNTTGYDNIASQTVVAESGTVRYVRFEAFEGRVKRSGDTMTGCLTLKRDYPAINLERGTTNNANLNYDMDIDGVKKRMMYLRNIRHDSVNRFELQLYDENGTNGIQILSGNNSSGEAYISTPSWSVGTNDNSDKILTIKMANSLPSLVHTTGNETVAGTKTFTSPIYLNNNAPLLQQRKTDFTVGTLPTSTDIGGVRVIDSVGTYFAGFRWTVNPSGDGEAYIETNNFDKTVVASLKVYAKANKDTYATAPTTPSTATSNEIATADWSIGKFVQKSGDTMTNSLGLTYNRPVISLKSTEFAYSDPVSEATTVFSLMMSDKGGNFMGGLFNRWYPNGDHKIYLENKGKGGKMGQISLYANVNEVYAEAPTPSDKADNSTKISTTAWVNSASSVVHTTGNETISGAKTFTSYPVIKSSSKPLEIHHTGMDYTKADGSVSFLHFYDKNGVQTARIGVINEASKSVSINQKWNNVWYDLGIKFDGTKGFGYAPTTPNEATSNEIATANWVNGKLATRVQKLTLNGTISDGVIVTTDIQANDTVFVSITTPSDISPITYAVDIPSTVEGAMLVRSSSHITEKSDGKLYSIDIYAQYRKTAWHIGIIQRGITGGGVSNPAVVSFYGHILRAG